MINKKFSLKRSNKSQQGKDCMKNVGFKPVSLLKRGDCYQLYYRNPDGVLRRMSGGNNLAIAQKTASQFNDWLMVGKFPEIEIANQARKEISRTISLREFFPIFMARHGKTLSESTQELYQGFFDNVSRCKIGCEKFVDVILPEVTKDMVSRYMSLRVNKDGRKPATANREATFVRNMLQRAVEYDIMAINPLNGLRMFKEDNRRDVSNITPEIVSSLVKVLHEPLASIVEFAVLTGFRKTNVLDLTIDQVVFHDLKDTGEVRHIVKGGKYRTDPLGKQAVKVLKRVINKRKDNYVFINPYTSDRYKTISTSFGRAVKKLNIKIATGQRLCFHDCRRLCGTWLLNSGRSLDEVREVLGHSDRATTDRYARLKVSGDVFDKMPELR